tara:strand:+ start:1572 stop:1865 length:294 start_codon:yes stop_codon:yes gene_type:complete
MGDETTLQDDLRSGRYNGQFYEHYDNIPCFAYQIVGLSPNETSQIPSVILSVKKYGLSSGKEPIDPGRIRELGLELCLNDQRTDAELIKKIQQQSSY